MLERRKASYSILLLSSSNLVIHRLAGHSQESEWTLYPRPTQHLSSLPRGEQRKRGSFRLGWGRGSTCSDPFPSDFSSESWMLCRLKGGGGFLRKGSYSPPVHHCFDLPRLGGGRGQGVRDVGSRFSLSSLREGFGFHSLATLRGHALILPRWWIRRFFFFPFSVLYFISF
ncbi:hypothetical protein IE53DRAFT_259061 [Violaceomyces palustris]|uniref:Uncharacterized protein n=1 Tax=Violaceomyces palustris TaxID=1673888 RepID=A0ACD0P3M7_9BASI|nr:hypothetical protein IE53DRAFT_259061 [Violaceomyces palustris]